MLTAFRNFAKSWVAAILMGLLIVSFVGWGAQKYGFSAIRGDEVVKAGSRTVNSVRFRREYDNAKKTLEERMQQEITPEAAAQNHLERLVLNQVATREALFEMLERMGVRVSDKLVL